MVFNEYKVSVGVRQIDLCREFFLWMITDNRVSPYSSRIIIWNQLMNKFCESMTEFF